MADAFLGEIKLFAGNYAPVGWLPCDGRKLPINVYEALYALIGTTYGGDGQQTFAVPNLQGQLPVGQGQGKGLSNYPLGAQVGSDTVTLNQANLPPHTHTLGNGAEANSTSPKNNAFAPLSTGVTAYMPATTPSLNTQAMDVASVSSFGGGQPHENRMPSLALNYIICVSAGTFPPQP